jgi:hypothetical protein
MTPEVVRYSERPELWDSLGELSSEVWPEYNLHGDVLNQYWNQLYTTFPEWQFVLFDTAAGQVLAEGHTIPVAWDGTDAGVVRAGRMRPKDLGTLDGSRGGLILPRRVKAAPDLTY